MRTYVVRRLLQLGPVLLLSSIAIWALTFTLPGSPAYSLAGRDASPEMIATIEGRLGLDRPVFVQYFIWLGNALTGDLGTSLTSRGSVLGLLVDRVPATFQLAFLSMTVALIVALPVGALSALRPGSWVSRAAHTYEAVGLAVPAFWLGLLLILGVSLKLDLLPALAHYVPLWRDPISALRNLALPSLTVGLHVGAVTSRFVGNAVGEVLDADFVRTARSKGVPERRVIVRHAFRNALLPIVTIVGLQLAGFLGGLVVVEVVFNYPGLGRLLYGAVLERDYALIQGAVLFVVVLFLVVNLVVDLLYAVFDPRVRLG